MIYTGYFAKEAAYREAGLVPVSIARFPAKGFSGHRCSALAPTPAMLNMQEARYVPMYNEHILGPLDAVRLGKELQALGEDVVLLCFERPSDFCHRQLVSKWLRQYGVPCVEYEVRNPDVEKPEVETLSLF